MKDFLSIFSSSAKELQKVRTLTVSGVFMAVSLILRFLAINVNADIRISFAFIGIMIIAMLYGPVPSMMASFGIDFIGYILDGSKVRDYNLLIAVIAILSGMIYGVFLYRKKDNKKIIIYAVAARITDAIICNIILKSMIIYGSYINSDFPFSGWKTFFIWSVGRLVTNLIQTPIDVIIIVVVFPIAIKAYNVTLARKQA